MEQGRVKHAPAHDIVRLDILSFKMEQGRVKHVLAQDIVRLDILSFKMEQGQVKHVPTHDIVRLEILSLTMEQGQVKHVYTPLTFSDYTLFPWRWSKGRLKWREGKWYMYTLVTLSD